MAEPTVEKSSLSFVIPVFNEEESLRELLGKMQQVLSQNNLDTYEVLFVDDGSTDTSWKVIESLSGEHPEHVKGIRLRRNFGKSAALTAGFEHATGQIVFTMDADLQDDPVEIPRFLEKLANGFDLVSGWKRRRHDPLSKTLPSKLFNATTAFFSGVKLNDFNCGYKAYRKEVIESISIQGDLHRYIPVLAHYAGFRVGEIAVQHHPRPYGKSKYGIERFARGCLDLLSVLVLTRYVHRPAHIFGGLGLGSLIGGLGILFYLTCLWFLGFRPIGNRPLFFLGILLTILAVQMISIGLLSELIVRNVRLADAEKHRVGQRLNLPEPPSS